MSSSRMEGLVVLWLTSRSKDGTISAWGTAQLEKSLQELEGATQEQMASQRDGNSG